MPGAAADESETEDETGAEGGGAEEVTLDHTTRGGGPEFVEAAEPAPAPAPAEIAKNAGDRCRAGRRRG